MVASSPSRNAPCHCGSGRRFKECHGRLPGREGHGQDVASLMQRALALQVDGRLEEAAGLYLDVLGVADTTFDALHMLGVIRHQQQRFDEALALFDRALRVYDGHAAAYSNRGRTLMDVGRAEEALRDFDKAIALDPALVEAYASRGSLLVRLQRLDDAARDFESGLALTPSHPQLLDFLATVQASRGHHAAAVATFARLLDVEPTRAHALGSLVHAQAAACDWTDYADRCRRLAGAVREGRPEAPFVLLARFDDPSLHRLAAETPAAPFHAVRSAPHRDAGRQRIRLGYMSSDFREHAMAYLVTRLLERHDRSEFEVIGLSHGPPADTPARRRVRQACDAFHDAFGLSDPAYDELIRDQRIDILVDLNGLTNGARLGVLARRPAPVQMTYLGYPGTTGLASIDYLIADAYVVPAGLDAAYTEAVIRLPVCYQANDDRPVPDAAGRSRREHGLPDDGLVLCCFNNSYKITPEIFDVWMRLLRAVDDAVLWLLRDSDDAVANLRKEATARGVDPERLVFAGRAGHDEHLARHRHADLFVDTFPYNAHTTASDALRMGLPLVTLSGRSFASRVAGSILRSLGLNELIAERVEAYEAICLRMATDGDYRNDVRRRLADAVGHADVFDADRIRSHIERAYQLVWQRYREGQRPTRLDIRGT